MAPKVNGNGGNDKNAMDAIKAYLEALRTQKGGKTEKTEDTVTLTPPTVNKTYTDAELLTAGTFIPGFEISKASREEAKRNADLEALPQTSLAGVTRADRKEAFNAVSDPLVQAYMYGPISENTFAAFSKFDGTTFPPEVTADLLADVEIQAA